MILLWIISKKRICMIPSTKLQKKKIITQLLS
jgi:hypothetical protein